MTSGRERLRDWIKRSKVNQQEAAKIIGIHPVELSQWLSGERTPGLKKAAQIERVTGISVYSWLLSDIHAETSSEPVTDDNA